MPRSRKTVVLAAGNMLACCSKLYLTNLSGATPKTESIFVTCEVSQCAIAPYNAPADVASPTHTVTALWSVVNPAVRQEGVDYILQPLFGELYCGCVIREKVSGGCYVD